MQNLSIKRMLVLSVVGRAIREVQTDPKRGLRRMVDLGREMAHGNTPQAVFAFAQKQLKQPNSPWYDLLVRAVREVDPKTLQMFSVALAWDSLTMGVPALRAQGGDVPWALRLALDGAVSVDTLQKKCIRLHDLGVHTLFLTILNRAGLIQALELTIGMDDCAFVLSISPDLIDTQMATQLAAHHTIAVAVQMGERDATQTLNYLHQAKCLYGVRYRCGASDTAQQVREWLEQLCEIHGYFVIVDEQGCQAAQQVAQVIQAARHPLGLRCLPIAAQADFAAIASRVQQIGK